MAALASRGRVALPPWTAVEGMVTALTEEVGFYYCDTESIRWRGGAVGQLNFWSNVEPVCLRVRFGRTGVCFNRELCCPYCRSMREKAAHFVMRAFFAGANRDTRSVTPPCARPPTPAPTLLRWR